MSRFDNPRNTAPSLEALQNTFMKVPRSTHDFSCTKDFNMWCGAIIPIDHIDTLPNEDYELSYDIILESVSPLVKNLKTGFTLYVHASYMRDSQLWEGAENFYTRGRSGQVSLSKPKILRSINSSVATNNLCSLMDFMGYHCDTYTHTSVDTNSPTLDSLLTLSKTGITASRIPHRARVDALESALPLVHYQRFYTEFYMNQNLLLNNTGVLPENQHHMLLPYNASYVNVLSYDAPNDTTTVFDVTPDGDYYVPSAENTKPLALAAIRYRQFKGDYFTTALPFADLVRGDIPAINMTDMGSSASIDFSDAELASLANTSIIEQGENVYPNTLTTQSAENKTYPFAISPGNGADLQHFQNRLVNALNQAKITINQRLTLANLRALEAYTIFAERMARTSGKYNDMIKAQFNWNPGHDTLMPQYIGGFYQNIDISSVTQQSSDSNGLGLGAMSSKAISAGRNNIGHFHSPDYGHILVCASIVPDILYQNNNIDRLLSTTAQEQVYFPILENLSPQMILNRELFVSGTSSDDNNGFGWTELFSEYKSRQNRAYGLLGASSPDDSFLTDYGAYAMIRRFTTTPTLSNEFVTMSPKNIPNNIWQLPDDVPFIATVNCNVRKTTCMSYVTQPGGLSSRIG